MKKIAHFSKKEKGEDGTKKKKKERSDKVRVRKSLGRGRINTSALNLAAKRD